MLDFGNYCEIEQKRYGVENEMFKYKIIGRSNANYYRKVPVDAMDTERKRGDMCEVVKAICCGIVEDKVETFRLCDVKQADDGSF